MKNHVWREYQRGVRSLEALDRAERKHDTIESVIAASRWICRWCRNVNGLPDEFCKICGMPKPEIICIARELDE